MHLPLARCVPTGDPHAMARGQRTSNLHVVDLPASGHSYCQGTDGNHLDSGLARHLFSDHMEKEISIYIESSLRNDSNNLNKIIAYF